MHRELLRSGRVYRVERPARRVPAAPHAVLAPASAPEAARTLRTPRTRPGVMLTLVRMLGVVALFA
jgi:hypothetical protein